MSFPIIQHRLGLLDQYPDAYTVIFPDSTTPMGTRAGLARGMKTEIATAPQTWVENDFDNVPIFQRPIGNATWNGTEGKWRSFVPSTSPFFTLTPTEPCREVVYRCTPFWYRVSSVGSCGPHAVSVADRPLPGFRLAPIFQNGSDYVYRPVFQMSVGTDGLPHSRGGTAAMQGNPAELWATARRYDARARLEGAAEWFSDLLLQMVELACADPGYLLIGNQQTESGVMGQIVAAAKSSCYSSADGEGCFWRGKENPWGNVPELLADLLAVAERQEDGVRPRLYRMPQGAGFTGTFGRRCIPVGVLPAVAQGVTTPLSGYTLFTSDPFLYPTQAAQGNMAAKGSVTVESGGLADIPLCVSVGDKADGSASALHFSLAYTDSAKGNAVSARLRVG